MKETILIILGFGMLILTFYLIFTGGLPTGQAILVCAIIIVLLWKEWIWEKIKQVLNRPED